MLIDAGIVLASLLALGILLARPWLRPALIVVPPKKLIGFIPPA